MGYYWSMLLEAAQSRQFASKWKQYGNIIGLWETQLRFIFQQQNPPILPIKLPFNFSKYPCILKCVFN